MMLSRSGLVLPLLLSLSLAACAAQSHTDSSGAPAKTKAEIKAEKVAAKEEAVAKKYPQPPANSPLAKIKRDMNEGEVRTILGPPTTQYSHENGKRWIPGYGAFAPDLAQTEFVYHGLGTVTFNQNKYNGGLFVHHVTYDPSK